MKKNLFLILLIICGNAMMNGQRIYYYGVNGKPLPDEEGAITKRHVSQIKDNRIEIEASAKWKNEWRNMYSEKIKIHSENEYLVRRYAQGRQTDRFVRFYTWESGNIFKFVEMDNDVVVKKGSTSSKLPLCLEGEIIDYYPGEIIKSKSVYQNNQLVSNENWLPDGQKYIDNVFYSADIPPSYDIETANLHQHISSEFSKHKLIDIYGTILIGFVIMENGELTGARIIRGISSDLNQIAVDAIDTFPGKWTPALLNNLPVRYYCTMPINFKLTDEFISFDMMEFTDGMIFY